MHRLNKIPKTKTTSDGVQKPIPKTKAGVIKVVFSFEQFRCKSIKCKEFNNNFNNLWEYGKWSLLLLDRLSNYSTMDISELKNAGTGTRCHVVEGKALERLKNVLFYLGIVVDDQLNEDGLWELSLGTANGRVFGYFIDNIFYALLFDPHHLIYPNNKLEAQQDLLYRNYDPWREIAN